MAPGPHQLFDENHFRLFFGDRVASDMEASQAGVGRYRTNVAYTRELVMMHV